MKQLSKWIFLLFLTLGVIGCKNNSQTSSTRNNDPLPSWNDTPLKAKIIDFIQSSSSPRSKNFVPRDERIAALDLDGTLMVEKPESLQNTIARKKFCQMAEENPRLRKVQPYKASIEEDQAYIKKHDEFFHLASFPGVGHDEYMKHVRTFMATEKNPVLGLHYDELFYEPMLELVRLLNKHKFEVYICSGSQTECIRSFAKDILNIPHKHVIGSDVSLCFEIRDGQPTFTRQETFRKPYNLGDGKAENLIHRSGYLPIFSIGNTEGDVGMLRATVSNPNHQHLAILVDHDDSEREFEYHKEELLKIQENEGWEKLSMKEEFKRLFKE